MVKSDHSLFYSHRVSLAWLRRNKFRLRPSHRFAAGSRPKVHRTFDLSLAPPAHEAAGGHTIQTYPITILKPIIIVINKDQ